EDGIRDFHVTGVQTCALPILSLTNVTHCYQPIQETYDMHARKLLIATLLTLALPAIAAEKTAEVHAVTADGIGEKIGTVTFADSTEGLVITPDLRQLSPGAHGFHIHQKASCAAATKDGKQVAAGAAGGHYDPA